MDAAFSVIVDGVQSSIHASRVLHMERLRTTVGPIAVEVVDPLVALRLKVDDAANGIKADILFRARTEPIEEPRFIRRSGPRTIMDYTRLTQNGTYEGWLEVKGKRHDLSPSIVSGTRDRSWGIRPIGAADAQPVAPPPVPQFYWLWSPLNFEDRATFFHVNADEEGEPWNIHARVIPVLGRSDFEARDTAECAADVIFEQGTRRASSAELIFNEKNGPAKIELTPKFNFQMCGIGYTHPEWGHGAYKGELETGFEEWALSDVDPTQLHNLHVQAFCKATYEDADGVRCEGIGILEQLIIGAHKPSGFVDLLDMAKG